VALQYSLKSGIVITPTLLFLLSIALVICEVWCCKFYICLNAKRKKKKKNHGFHSLENEFEFSVFMMNFTIDFCLFP
jgi:hypothetical protein